MNNLPDFNRLRAFYHVLAAGSYKGAAKQLHVSVAAISQAMQALEEEVQDTLFVRVGRTAQPTASARALFDIIEPFHEALRTHFDIPTDIQRGIRISAPPHFGETILLPILRQFRQAHPHIPIHAQLSASTHPISALEQDRLDLCVIDSLEIMHGRPSHLHVHNLMTDIEYLVATPKLMQQHVRGSAQYKEIVQMPMLSYHEAGAELRHWFQQHYQQMPDRIIPTMVVDHPRLMKACVREGLGIGLLPISMIEKELCKGSLVQVGKKSAKYRNTISLVTLRDKPATEHVQALAHLLRDTCS